MIRPPHLRQVLVQRLAARLQSALEVRSVTDPAIGILMSRSGGTEDEALEQLRAVSQGEFNRVSQLPRLLG